MAVIIPTLNEAARLPALLAALGAGAPPGALELVVSDGGSEDGTVAVAENGGCAVVHSPPGRARQLNAGAAASTAERLWFLHADTLPPANFWSHLERLLGGNRSACFAIDFDRHSVGLDLFSRASRNPSIHFRFGDQSLCVSRKTFVAVGGYDEAYPIMEGHEIARRLRAMGAPVEVLPAAVQTSARRYLRHGVWFTQGVFTVIYLGWLLGVPMRRLVGVYLWAFR